MTDEIPEDYYLKYPEQTEPLNFMSDNHLQWIYDRMVYQLGQNPNVDYMIKLKSIIDEQKQNAALIAALKELIEIAIRMEELTGEHEIKSAIERAKRLIAPQKE